MERVRRTIFGFAFVYTCFSVFIIGTGSLFANWWANFLAFAVGPLVLPVVFSPRWLRADTWSEMKKRPRFKQ